jgi:hypothetical protein
MSSTPKQLQLFLIPTPGSKPEFLTTVEGIAKTPLDSSLPDKLVLENYTRDPWAWKPNSSVWQSFQVKSVDGRNKLPGFLKYLKDRQKSAYGRFADKESIWVISYIQKPNKDSNEVIMECRLAWDLSTIPGCPMKPPPSKAAHFQAPPAAVPPAPAQPKQNINKPKRKGGGLLGNLVASQKRTNAHVQVASSKLPQEQAAATAAAAAGEDDGGGKKTAQQVMAEFRQSMEEKMLDFDISSDPVLKVQVSLAQQQKDLATLEDKAKITMEILKYIVYEQAEEVNEEWIAYKEPSEFMDEITIAVYKEGEAPPEVLEDINKGDLPDEVRGQQRALQQEQQKQMEMKDRAKELQLQRKALQEKAEDDDEQQVLNQNKRDRRTIEEIQRDRDQEAKRARM